MRPAIRFAILSRILGLVLLAAGLLKAYDAVVNGPPPESNAWPAPWAAVALVAFELVFGLWLLVGLYPRISWWLAAACFIALLGVSFDKAMGGQAACGCFGPVRIHPWYSFAFDVVALIGLLFAQPFGEAAPSRGPGWYRWAGFVGLSGAALVGLGVAWYSPPAILDDDGGIEGTSGIVQLQPRAWVGRRFPLVKHIDIGPKLARGRWAVMFYRTNCSACRTAIPRFVGLAYQLSSQSGATRFALVEVPRPGEESTSADQGSVCVRGCLTAARKWRIETPTYLVLDGDIVTKATDAFETLMTELRIVPTAAVPEGGSLFPDYRKIRREMFLREIACGPLALIALLQEFGITLNEEEADRLLAEAGDKGIDMLRLKQLAEQHGLHGLGVAVSTEKLRAMGQRAIVHLHNVGFVPVIRYTKEGIGVVYPFEPPGILPDDIFAKGFGDSGRALLISDTPLDAGRLGLQPAESDETKPQGPHLRLSRSLIAAGRLHRKKWEASITLTNDGTAPLAITEISTTCPCFRASVGRKQLAPGESTLLHAQGTQLPFGGFTYAVLLKTNQPGKSPTKVPVRGYLEPPLAFERPVVRFVGLVPGQKKSAEIKVDLPRGLDPARLRLKAPEKGPLTAELWRSNSGVAVLVHWQGADKPGWYRYQLQLFAESATDAVATPLPCVVEVVPELTVYPSSLLIDGSKPGQPWTRRLLIECKHPLAGKPSVRWSDQEAGALVRVKLMKAGERLWRVELTGETAAVTRLTGRRIKMTFVYGSGREVSVFIEFVSSRKSE